MGLTVHFNLSAPAGGTAASAKQLAAGRSPELRVKISDEGDFWPRRSLTKLRQNLDQMNGLVAAAGALKDADEASGRTGPVQSPIFAHRQFERLEAAGAARVAPALKKLRALTRAAPGKCARRKAFSDQYHN